MKTTIIAALSLTIYLSVAYCGEMRNVGVGGYVFPPFVENIGNRYQGVSLDLIAQLNACQSDYHFYFVPTAPKRRYLAFDKGKYDLIMFESLDWGWEGKPIQASDVFLTGGEVYITKREPHKDQSYFDSLNGKSIAGILGYHYGFAGFNADTDYLEKEHHMFLFTHHQALFKPVIAGRIDIGVVTISYLKAYLRAHPEIRDQILISKKLDQEYQHTILVRTGSRPNVQEIDTLLKRMKSQGILKRIWMKYGIE